MNCPYPKCDASVGDSDRTCSACGRVLTICEEESCGQVIPSVVRFCPKCSAPIRGTYSWMMEGGSSSKAGSYSSFGARKSGTQISLTMTWDIVVENFTSHGLLEAGGYVIVPQEKGRISVLNGTNGSVVTEIDLGRNHEIMSLPCIQAVSYTHLTLPTTPYV